MKFSFLSILGPLVISRLVDPVLSVDIDPTNFDSIHHAASLFADGALDYYSGLDYGQSIGTFVFPYYWWHAGVAWGSMIDYWYYMNNDTYVNITSQALLYQVGQYWDYMPANFSTSEGNDDQVFWGIACIAAAEKAFPNPPAGQPQWTPLAQAVFHTMSSRWDNETCGGGLRWQIFQFNNGYDYKNSVANGGLFHLGARLARYTSNQTYYDWCDKIWNWMSDTHLISVVDDKWMFIYDGFNVRACGNITKLQWTYNQGLMLAGAAVLYNATGNQTWHDRASSLLESSAVFFNNSIMYEAACETTTNGCNNDQMTFKAIFSRMLGVTAVMMPEHYNFIMDWLQPSAVAAGKGCSGGIDGHTCSVNWNLGYYDGKWGLPEEISALEVVQNLLVGQRPGPLTEAHSNASRSNDSAGLNDQGDLGKYIDKKLKLHTKDFAGAGIITAIIGCLIIGSIAWLLI